MEYDVLREPWIPVHTLSGEQRHVGVREALSKAHEFCALRAENPLVTFGVHRLLIAVLQDALRPDDSIELLDLQEAGQFDVEALEQYYASCRASHECFDLFDKALPFMQTAFQPGEETELLPVASLFLELPSGNNHVFFNHALEKDVRSNPARALRALCTLPSFQLSFSRSRHTSVNGKPPRYFLYAGNTLFETLAYSMVSMSMIGNLPYDDPPPAWRDPNPVPNRQPIPGMSLLHGLTARPLRVQLSQGTNGSVVGVRMAYGYDYKIVPNWSDPHVAYFNHPKYARYPLQCVEGRETWRDMGTILTKEGRPLFMLHAGALSDALAGSSPFVDCRVFGLVSIQKTALLMPVNWVEEGLPLYRSLLENPLQSAFLRNCLEKMEEVNGKLAWVLGQTAVQLKTGKRDKKARGPYRFLIAQAQNTFLFMVRGFLMDDFVPMLETSAAQTPAWDVVCREAWAKQMLSMSQDALRTVISPLAQSALLLQWRALAENCLRAVVLDSLKKGGFLPDDKTGKKRAKRKVSREGAQAASR